jgi:hypothetical protein
MSTISKVAVYDARLMQEEPAYAVQKGALSVSVAPFQAISANQSQMTFQILVPSLNVFVDRKISLSTSLSFVAQLFYSGPRGLTVRQYAVTAFASLPKLADPGWAGNSLKISTTFLDRNGAALLLPIGTTIYKIGQVTASANPPIPIGRVVEVVDGTNYKLDTYNYAAFVADQRLTYILDVLWDAPSADMSVSLAQDAGFSGARAQAFQPAGYATAVSAKDLALVPFPVQSALSNMTATMNDCTVTTNGDTLREQILLTSTHETLKQRTTPSKMDTYSWGRDDANNESGNFSSYSAANGYGDIPNGAWPLTWFLPNGTTPLRSVIAPSGGVGAVQGAYPFLDVGVSANFNLGGPQVGSNLANAGCGWYIAQCASGVQDSGNGIRTLVPFVNGQPVWTTAFPGGDLQGVGSNGAGPYAADADGTIVAPAEGGTPLLQFSITFVGQENLLTLGVDVPPYSMIGARLYDPTVLVFPEVGETITPLAFVCGIKSGALGKKGSTYLLLTPAGAAIAAVANGLALQAGFRSVTNCMPVYGAVETVEPLVISPLIWADSAEFQSVGLYGMTNMQFILNFAVLSTTSAAKNGTVVADAEDVSTLPYWVDDLSKQTNYTGNILRSSSIRTIISDMKFSSPASSQYGPWSLVPPTLFVNFLTPGPDVTLPLVSTVPYVEFPRYVSTRDVDFTADRLLPTNTISLTSIPDMVLLYVKPATQGPSQLNGYIPIENVNVTFDNFSNLCSGFKQFNLYESAVAAGLDMDWHQWRGYTQGNYPSLARAFGSLEAGAAFSMRQPGVTQLSGGPILLRLGTDITLSPGLAPGCLGNYSFQANLTVSNSYGFYDWVKRATIYIVAINTGFFETVRGQSAIRKTILNSADVEAASPETGMTKTDLHRLVGRGTQGARGMSTMLGGALRRTAISHSMGSKRLLGGGYGRSMGSAMMGGPGGKRMMPGGGSGL